MCKLTTREEQIMRIFWNRGPLFVREIVDIMDDPKPHFNTISTIVRSLEERGLLSHESFGSTYRYFPLLSQQDFGHNKLLNIVDRFYKDSYINVVSSLINEEKIDIEELKNYIREIEKQ